MNQQTPPKQDHPIVAVRRDITASIGEFAKVLPPSISPEAFARVAITAVQNSPMLLKCDRQSLLSSLMKAAEDKLLPDGREGALVPYKKKINQGGNWIEIWIVQWLPMVDGVRKLLWESAKITLRTRVVYPGDEWDYQEGDQPHITHRPKSSGNARSDNIVAVYSIATFPDGRIERDWMWKAEIEQIRAKSRAGSGPWSDPVFYPEMAIKTVVHHHSKSLPLSPDLRRTIDRDNFLYDLAGQQSQQSAPRIVTQATASLPSPSEQPMEWDQAAAIPARTVDGVMSAMATGGEVAQPARRTRRTKAEIEATRANAGAGGASGIEGAQQPPRDAFGLAPIAPGDVAGEVYDPETGEITQAEDVGMAEPPQQPQAKPASVLAALKNLMDSAQPQNREEYFAWIFDAWKEAIKPEQQDAVRQYWAMTGGMRAQFGISADDTKAMADRMRRRTEA